ncbi:hypothetical protein VIAQ111709_06275 [Vibrio aquimaris]|uniref:Uncharacterized protein n=1 Tax=Vibrio aquimaris TaxID=2587862 RepID=A0A5P9CIY9_9VIBR|nr:hypothetical protein FIV01_04425 [Vibrio aquimaris]
MLSICFSFLTCTQKLSVTLTEIKLALIKLVVVKSEMSESELLYLTYKQLCHFNQLKTCSTSTETEVTVCAMGSSIVTVLSENSTTFCPEP